MKTLITPSQFQIAKSLKANILCVILTAICSTLLLPLKGQVIAGPGMHWFQTHWYDPTEVYTPATRDASGEDWCYDIVPYFDETVLEGYAAFGFSSIVNDEGDHSCFSCFGAAPAKEFFERDDYFRGCNYPKIAEMDKLGNVEWYQIYQNGVGYLRQGIQLSDGSGYIAVGVVKIEGGVGSIPYQYASAISAGTLPLCTEGLDLEAPTVELEEQAKSYKLLYVLKTDMEGEFISDGVYGLGEPNEVAYNESEGFGIIETSDGNVVITGLANSGGYWDTNANAVVLAAERGWVFQIDPTTLDMLWETTIMDGDYRSIATCLIENGESIYVAGTKSYDADVQFLGKVNITKLSLGGSIASTLELNVATTGDSDIGTFVVDACTTGYNITNSVAYNLAIHDGDLLVASTVNRNKWVRGEAAESIGKVYRINLSPSMSVEGFVPFAEDEQMLTFDLKAGITVTSDGGYAVVTTVHDPTFTEIDDCAGYEKTYYPGSTHTFLYEQARIWNADAYIAKFDASDNMEWEQVYPTTFDDFNEATLFPNDIKRMECYYEILETEDGGFIIAGNNSMNFDDDIVLKTYNDCNRYVTYTTGSGDINVTGTYTISTDVTWNANKKVRGIIEIEDDATLTINNSAIIQFADSKADAIPTYIRVKRGGRLVIEGGAKLTGNTECGTMWEGIYVEGTYGTNHPTPASLLTAGYFVTGDAHGLVKISGDATIEYARNGVTLGLPIEMDDYPDYGGGILIADNGNFLNNTIDVMMWPFDKNNVTFIRHCDFTTSAALPDPVEIPEAHIKMIQVKNVNIRGNVFENTTVGTVYSVANRGMGILGYNATFKANDNPNGFAATGGTGSDPNYFNDLYYGVYAAQFTTLSSNILVNGNVFADNYNGIYVGGATLPEVNFNTINIPLKTINNYGIYIDGCDGYGVEENNLTGAGANLLGTQIGIVVNESGTGSNWIYRNNFSALKYGVRMQGNNGDTDDGLEIKCNTFEEGKYDISLISGATTATMKKDQGVCGTETSPASNLFTDPTFADINTQIKTSADITSVNYYNYTFHLDDDAFGSPFAAPAIYSDPIDPWEPGEVFEEGCDDAGDIDDFVYEDYCPTNFTSGSGGSGRMAALGPRKKRPASLMMPLTYNPYQYLKPAGVAYEAFLANMRFNMLASYYMQADYTDSLESLIADSEYILAKSLKSQMASEASDFAAAEEILSDLSTDEAADSKGYDSPLSGIGIALLVDTLTWQQSDPFQYNIFKEEATRDDREGIQALLLLELLDGKNYIEPINELNEEVTADELKYIQSNFPPAPVNSIQVYPHPLSTLSFVEIHLDNVQKNTRFIITDMQGRLISQFPIDNTETYIKLDNSQLEPGTYVGYIADFNGERISKQIVVIR